MSDEDLQIPCAACDSLNRVPRARLGDKPTCGQCKAPLFGDHPRTLTAASFRRLVEKSGLPVLVDFWATWCPPCRQMTPHFEEANRLLVGRAILAKFDIDTSAETADDLGIRAVPTVVLYDGGREVRRHSGFMPAPALVAFIDQAS